MSIWAKFDYAKMAAEALERAEKLEAELKALRVSPAQGFEEILLRNSQIHLKEDQLMEQRSDYRLFVQRAIERGQLERKCIFCAYYGVDLEEMVCHLHWLCSEPYDTCKDWKLDYRDYGG